MSLYKTIVLELLKDQYPALQERLRKERKLLVETGSPRIPFLIAAPTMRVPMILRETVNPYLAARAALLLIRHGMVPVGAFADQPVASVISTVAFPGLGTGVGQVDPNTCAVQVRSAIEEVVLGAGNFPQTWAEAQHRHQRLSTDRVRDLQLGWGSRLSGSRGDNGQPWPIPVVTRLALIGLG